MHQAEESLPVPPESCQQSNLRGCRDEEERDGARLSLEEWNLEEACKEEGDQSNEVTCARSEDTTATT